MFGKRLTLICWLVTAHVISSPIGLAELDEDTIVGIWLFDEGKGETAKDISKNGNHAKLIGAKWTPDGKHGKAVEFDGTNYVRIGASKSTDDYRDGFTYCLWLKPLKEPANPHCRVIERNWHCPGIYIGKGNFFASILSGGGMQPAVDANRAGEYKVDKWTFIALTYDKKMLLLYVDDEVVAETKVGKPDLVKEHDGGAIRLASWKDSGWNFIGVIDEVGVLMRDYRRIRSKIFPLEVLNEPCLFLLSLNSRQPGHSLRHCPIISKHQE